jgi:2-haloacid dehalogenase
VECRDIRVRSAPPEVQQVVTQTPAVSTDDCGGKAAPASTSGVKALTFDVFGTVVDWRSSIIREGELLAKAKGFRIDWAQFADAWRAGYVPAMDKVQRGEIPWTTIDGLNRLILNELLKRFQVKGLSVAEIDHLNSAWHRLMPWPDSVSGLNRLRSRYILATLSNGNVALLVNMAKNAGLPWDCVLSAELARHYKPHPEAYLTAARLLGLEPAQVMMVAAHPGDLEAARKVGFKTAFVHRPLEFGPDKNGITASEAGAAADVVASDFLDLAMKLGS